MLTCYTVEKAAAPFTLVGQFSLHPTAGYKFVLLRRVALFPSAIDATRVACG